ncbi:MAG: outer membrane lipoprotein carrier protein LolA [Eikenella sp.]|nr:outer membrane lipoprotein carrier protein LolA [Eikenella sp.]
MLKRLFALLLCLTFLPARAFDTAQLTTQLQQPATVQGSFTQQRFLRALSQPMQTEGRFALKNRHGLYWQIDQPFELRLRVRPDGIAQWSGGQWRPTRQSGQAAQVKLFMAVLGGDMRELQRQFDTRLNGHAGQWRLQLTPKTALMRQVFDSITVEGGQLVRRIELNEKQGDRTVIQFRQLQADKTLSGSAAQALTP